MGLRIEFLPLVDYDGILTEEERRRIIRRLHAMLAWVGSSVPEKEELEGEEVNLREMVADLMNKSDLSSEDVEKARDLAKDIREREKDLEQDITHGDISEEKAIELLEEARGLLRALDDLKHIRDKDKVLENKKALMHKVDDEKRWKKFVDKIKE